VQTYLFSLVTEKISQLVQWAMTDKLLRLQPFPPQIWSYHVWWIADAAALTSWISIFLLYQRLQMIL
jgi:hypothetical protein